MIIPDFIRRLSHLSWITQTIRALGLQNVARNIYFYVGREGQNLLRISCCGVETKFTVRTPNQYRNVEAIAISESTIAKVLKDYAHTGDIVYDVGSSLGFYTILLANVVGDKGLVVSFEPAEHLYCQLAENIQVNGLRNVRPYQKALGEWNGQAELYLGDESTVSEPPRLTIPYKHGSGEKMIEVVVGDDFAIAKKLPVPRIIKIDVEGYEFAVLRGLKQTLSHPDCQLVCVKSIPTCCLQM